MNNTNKIERKIAKDAGLKRFIRKIIHAAALNDFGRALLNSSFIRAIKRSRANKEQKDISKLIRNAINVICPDLVVKHGPFKGMKYSEIMSFGSALFPKLLGSYEREIQHIIEEACKQEYTEVVDVGCAEGYYAIGFAMRILKSKIYAYDTDRDAIRLCQKTAKLNNVDQRVIVGSFCNNETMQSIPFRGKGLIISDCEGYEMSLFSEKTIPILARHDLLIELHDFIDISISSIIRKRFEKTHEIIAVESITDINKAQTYHYEELKEYSLRERELLLGEGRPAIMQWFYMKSLDKSVSTEKLANAQ